MKTSTRISVSRDWECIKNAWNFYLYDEEWGSTLESILSSEFKHLIKVVKVD